jgi:hypothetical protein
MPKKVVSSFQSLNYSKECKIVAGNNSQTTIVKNGSSFRGFARGSPEAQHLHGMFGKERALNVLKNFLTKGQALTAFQVVVFPTTG